MGGFFRRIFLGRIFREDSWENSTKSYLNMEEIDLFVKICFFVKILYQGRRKEGGRKDKKFTRSSEVREAS